MEGISIGKPVILSNCGPPVVLTKFGAPKCWPLSSLTTSRLYCHNNLYETGPVILRKPSCFHNRPSRSFWLDAQVRRHASGRTTSLHKSKTSVVRSERGDGDKVRSPEEPSGNIHRSTKPFYVESDFWLQVGILVFALGFIDAGFSGDWSRIGVLTKETEMELQMAAVGVVPLAATLIWSIYKRRKVRS